MLVFAIELTIIIHNAVNCNWLSIVAVCFLVRKRRMPILCRHIIFFFRCWMNQVRKTIWRMIVVSMCVTSTSLFFSLCDCDECNYFYGHSMRISSKQSLITVCCWPNALFSRHCDTCHQTTIFFFCMTIFFVVQEFVLMLIVKEKIHFHFIIRRHNRGFCMLNKPRHDLIETSSPLLAGERFPADQQCELIFGPNSKVCPFTVTVSIFGQQVDQVSGMTRKQQILIHINAHLVD